MQYLKSKARPRTPQRSPSGYGIHGFDSNENKASLSSRPRPPRFARAPRPVPGRDPASLFAPICHGGYLGGGSAQSCSRPAVAFAGGAAAYLPRTGGGGRAERGG